jgi:prolyl-tRNA editing enzyme YbaK/EbsC (Cys-tRNA(Pro) deacylase)
MSDQVHPTVARVVEVLRSGGASGEVRHLEDSTRTARDAAAALGCEVGAIASSLLFVADDEPLLVLTSGAHRVDEQRVQALLGAGAFRRATVDEVRAATGFAIGGVAPVGHPRPLRTLVDEALRQHEVLWAAAGHPHAVFATSYGELLALTGGLPAVVGD